MPRGNNTPTTISSSSNLIFGPRDEAESRKKKLLLPTGETLLRFEDLFKQISGYQGKPYHDNFLQAAINLYDAFSFKQILKERLEPFVEGPNKEILKQIYNTYSASSFEMAKKIRDPASLLIFELLERSPDERGVQKLQDKWELGQEDYAPLELGSVWQGIK